MHLPLLFYTLTESLSDDPEFTRPDIGCFLLLIRCSMRPELEFFSTYFGILIFLLFMFLYSP